MTYAELQQYRESIYALAARYHVQNPRVFGSVAAGNQNSDSDIDMLVDATSDTTLFDMGGLRQELSQLLNTPVDVATPEDLSVRCRQQVMASAKRI